MLKEPFNLGGWRSALSEDILELLMPSVMFFIEQNLIFNGTCMWFDLVTIETSVKTNVLL